MSDPRDIPGDEVVQLVQRFEASLDEDNVEEARALAQALAERLGEDDPEVLYARAKLAWFTDGPEAAAELLEELLERDDAHAEAHYDLACIAEERGDTRAAATHFLRVRALDAEADREIGIGSDEEFVHIERVARGVLDTLPEPFGPKLATVPVMIERRPARALVAEGFDPRAFGLFEGPTYGDRDAPAPTRIVLFACNLLAEFPEEPTLSEEIEVTLLHEIGHYFGLEEEDLQRLGLD